MNALAHITARVSAVTGIDPNRLAPDALRRAAEQRRRAISCADLGSYWARLRDDPTEHDALIDHLVVPESWFFRDEQPFQFLRGRLRQVLRDHGTPLRILSVPCALGEEPYSIALTFLEGGLSAASFQIQGVDISGRLIGLAGHEPYRPTAFRSNLWGFQERYFAPQFSGDRLLLGKVQPLVRFEVGNLVAPDFNRGRQPYHIIFCRNLLIYLHPLAREQVLSTLTSLLVDGGWLFVGHAEGAIPAARDYRRVDHPGAFAFVKRSPRHEARLPTPQPAVDLSRVTPPHVPLARGPVSVDAPKPTASAVCDDLDVIQALADSGRMDEAEVRCRQHLEVMGSTGEAHYLMGIIAVARDQKGLARTHLEKAVYLDPGHVAALTHLALLAEARGDTKQAQRWRRKLNRAARAVRSGSAEPPRAGGASAETPIESIP